MLPINLPDGRVLYLDENTGTIVGEQSVGDAPGGNAQGDDWWRNPKMPPVPGGSDGSDDFDPNTDQVTGVVSLPGGRQISYIKNGQVRTVFVPSSDGGVSASTAFSQSQQNARSAADLAEQQRQFNESFGFSKAKYNTDLVEGQRQFNQSQDLTRGNTLLGLGSRPDTLIKYLYALRGLQTPQAIQGTSANLPGYQNVMGAAPQGAVPAPPAATPTPTIPGATPNPNYQGTTSGYTPVNPAANAAAKASVSQPGSSPAGVLIANGQPTNIYTPQSGPPAPALDTAKIPGYDAAMREKALNTVGSYIPGRQYAQGGVIPEPVMGKGMMSGQSYMFGEKGPEAVVPNDLFQKIMSENRGEMNYSENDGKTRRSIRVKPDNSYAQGGTIGYNPEVFNPAGLGDVVNRGYNSIPQVPLLPSVGVATGGTSLIPSAQRLNSLLPSEQQSYAGSLQDEFGVVPEDVFSLSRKLAPKVTGLTTPRYA